MDNTRSALRIFLESFIVPCVAFSLVWGAINYAQGTTIGARYPDVVALDITTEQDLALTVAYKTAFNAGYARAATPSAFVAERVRALFQDYTAQFVSGEQKNRLSTALDTATDMQKQAVAQILGVDLTITPPQAKP